MSILVKAYPLDLKFVHSNFVNEFLIFIRFRETGMRLLMKCL